MGSSKFIPGIGKDVKIPSGITIKSKAIPEKFAEQVPDDSIYFEGYANKAVRDRIGDLITPGFWSKATLDEYMKNPILLFMHQRTEAVGKILEVEGREDGLWCAGFVSKKWEKSWQVEEGIITSLSVWVWVDKAEWHEESDTFIMKEGQLLEISLATIPMNADSTFELSKSMSEAEYGKFRDHFTKTFSDMKIGEFLKSLIPGLNKKLGTEIPEEASAEDVLKSVADAADPIGKEDIVKMVAKAIADSDAAKKKAADDAAAKAKKDGEDEPPLTEREKSMQATIDKMEERLKTLEGDEAAGKAKGAGDKDGDAAPPKPNTVIELEKALGATQVSGKSKY